MPKRSQIILTALNVLLITLPYLIAWGKAGESYVFNGFLLNPIDGNSYLAKMYQGWAGEWQFTLPFSAEANQGGFLFLFYIFLGHVARWLGLSLIFTFHLARVAGSIVLCLVLARFIKVYLPNSSARTQIIGFALCLFGAGLGWLAAFFGGFTSDFWVAEAFPFLSMYSNPHFPLGLALVLDYFTYLKSPRLSGKLIGMFVKGLLLAVVMPFGVVLASVVTLGLQAWEYIYKDRLIRWWSLVFLVPGGLFLIYQYVVIGSDPMLLQWNEQNLTPTPAIWDVLIAFSPALIAAMFAIWHFYKRTSLYEYRVLVIWLVVGLVLAYIPFQLQRRFLLGYYIPVACLASILLGRVLEKPRSIARFGVFVFLAASMLTNVFILAGGLAATTRHDPKLYYPQDMQAAFEWMSYERTDTPLILASSDTGLLIPGATGWKVIYGHPYETPRADLRKSQVDAVFSGMLNLDTLDQFITVNRIEYIYYGPFERNMGVGPVIFDFYPVVYDNGDVQIYLAGAAR